MLFLAKNVILLIKYQFQVSIFDGFGQRKYGEATMSYHVLIVDDDPAICKLLSKVMVSNEMEPLVVNSGAAALDLIARQSNTLDMILMDITLGDMEGFDVIQTIRRNGVTTPVIIISGRNEDYDFMYGLSLGADDYVTKPFRPQILGAKVKALIRRSKSFSQENSQQISCGPFLCDTTTMRFYKNNVELNLSEKERSLLLLFCPPPAAGVYQRHDLRADLGQPDRRGRQCHHGVHQPPAQQDRGQRPYPAAYHHHPGRRISVCAVNTAFFHSQHRKPPAARGAAGGFWFYAGIKHKTIKRRIA